MNDSLRIGKRALTMAVAAATILWSIGFSAFVAPLTAHAATAGDVVKGTTLSTVYYYAADGQRYAFPNEKTYFTWYTDFSAVQTISDSALAAIPLAGNIVYRPGSFWIKIQSDPKTYAVTPQGTIRWVETEAVASGLAGSDWNMFIHDVPDVFFVDYTVGPSLTSAANAYNGALVLSSGSNYLIWNGQKRLITTAGWTANRFQTRFLLDGTGMNLAGIPAGADVSGAESVLRDTAQLGTSITGGLSISLASDTPASATIPGSASSVPFTKFKLMATAGAVTVNQIVVNLGGVGTTANIDDVYLYMGNTRLTDGRSINSSTRQATFSALNIALASGATEYLTVRADIAAAPLAGDTASIGINMASSVSGTATVSGTFPVVGNTMTFSTTTAGEIIIDKTGSISDPTIGQEETVIARFTVEANGEDAMVSQITLNVDNASDHSNYKLWSGTTLLGTGSVSNDLVTFVLTNTLNVQDGDSENLRLTADIGGEAADDVMVAVEEEADVLAKGGDFGFNLSVDITGYDETGSLCASAADDCSFSTIQGGELTFAFNGPPSDDIQIDGRDQVMMEFTLTAENYVDVQEFDVFVDCKATAGTSCTDGDADGNLDTTANGGLWNSGSAEGNLQDITIRKADGSTWMGPEELVAAAARADATVFAAGETTDARQTLTFTDDQIMNAGTSLDLLITVDVDNGAVADDVYNVTIDMSTVVAEDINGDGLATTDIVPGSDLVGHDFTLSASSLEIVTSTPPSDGTFVKGSSNVSVVAYSFEAGGTSDVTVTDVTFDVVADDDAAYNNPATDAVTVSDKVSSCSIYDSQTGALVDGPESPESAAPFNVIFNAFSWTIAAGESEKMILKCNFSNVDTDATAVANDIYAFFINDDGAGGTTDVTAEDEDGDTVDPTLGENNEDGSETLITITNSGDLTVTLDGGTPSSTLILGASTGISAAKYKFDAIDEPFLVRHIVLRNCVIPTLVADADDDCLDGGETAGADGIAAAVKISYQNEAGSTVTKTGFLSSGSVSFDNLDFFVPSDVTRTLTVNVDTNTVSSTGAASGSQISLNFDAEDTGAIGMFEAIGDSSGETLTEADVDTYIVANDMTVRKTKPTLSLASGSPSGAGIPGLSEVFRFNVSADSRGFVDLNAVTFKLTSTDGGASAWNTCGALDDVLLWEFYDAADPSEKLDDANDWSFLDGTTADDACTGAAVLRYAVLDMANGTTPVETIGAGETKTYVLRIDTTSASGVDDDSVRVDLLDQTEADGVNEDCVAGNVSDCLSYDLNDTDDGIDADTLGAISWGDDVEATEVNGDLVKNLPVTGGTIVY